MHQPLQVFRPDWNTAFCEHAEQARASRCWLLEHAAEQSTIVFTAHFPNSSAGKVTRRGDKIRLALCLSSKEFRNAKIRRDEDRHRRLMIASDTAGIKLFVQQAPRRCDGLLLREDIAVRRRIDLPGVDVVRSAARWRVVDGPSRRRRLRHLARRHQRLRQLDTPAGDGGACRRQRTHRPHSRRALRYRDRATPPTTTRPSTSSYCSPRNGSGRRQALPIRAGRWAPTALSSGRPREHAG
jgi:hypothetical protein